VYCPNRAAGGHGAPIRRPEADYLRDGVYELRAAWEGVQYRMLYFFHEERAVLSHGFVKEGSAVPTKEIVTALRHKRLFELNPPRHSCEE
jgi:phage-related protein